MAAGTEDWNCSGQIVVREQWNQEGRFHISVANIVQSSVIKAQLRVLTGPWLPDTTWNNIDKAPVQCLVWAWPASQNKIESHQYMITAERGGPQTKLANHQAHSA